MKKAYLKPVLGNTNLVSFEDAYTCDHSGVKTGGCTICGTGGGFGGTGGGFGGTGGGFGGTGGGFNFNWSALLAFFYALFGRKH